MSGSEISLTFFPETVDTPPPDCYVLLMRGPQGPLRGEQDMNAIYIDYNGRTACAEHGGAYLKAALQATPNARTIDTPLGDWVRLSAKEAASPGMDCETCDMHKSGHTDYVDPHADTHHDEMSFSMPVF